MLFPWDYDTHAEENTKRNSITCQTDQQSPSISQIHIFIRIPPIKDKRRKFVSCKKYPSSQHQRDSGRQKEKGAASGMHPDGEEKKSPENSIPDLPEDIEFVDDGIEDEDLEFL